MTLKYTHHTHTNDNFMPVVLRIMGLYQLSGRTLPTCGEAGSSTIRLENVGYFLPSIGLGIAATNQANIHKLQESRLDTIHQRHRGCFLRHITSPKHTYNKHNIHISPSRQI